MTALCIEGAVAASFFACFGVIFAQTMELLWKLGRVEWGKWKLKWKSPFESIEFYSDSICLSAETAREIRQVCQKIKDCPAALYFRKDSARI